MTALKQRYSELLKQVQPTDDVIKKLDQQVMISNFLCSLHTSMAFRIARDMINKITDNDTRELIKQIIQGDYHSADVEELQDWLFPDAAKQLIETEKELYQRGLIDITGKWIQGYGRQKMFEAYCLLLIRYGYFKRVIQTCGQRKEVKESDCLKFLKRRYEFDKYSQHKLSEEQARQLLPWLLDMNSVKN